MARSRRAPAPLAAPAGQAAALNARRRTRELDALADAAHPLDLLVIGGGVTGAGVALDAATRGLRVALVESRDLAFGTSRWSSKLVHGGLRYLATGDFAVAHESAVERHLLMTRTAPHLIRPLAQLLPLVSPVTTTQQAVGGLGFAAGDVLRSTAGTASAVLPSLRYVRPQTALRLAPATRRSGLRGGLLAHDGQLVDDARLVVALARSAAAFGATVLTRVRAEAVTGTGAVLRDGASGGTLTVNARAVVNASGVWASSVDPSVRLRPSRGTHLVLDAATLGNPSAALTVPLPGSVSRYVFALPQQLGRVIVGLTDEDAPGPIPDVPEPTESEIAFLLATLSSVLEHELPRTAVIGAYAGLRPLIDSGTGATSDASREHHVEVSQAGIVNVLGGKLTTYRRMAEDAVDLAVRHSGLEASGCRTTNLSLVGAGVAAVPVPTGAPASLTARFGAEAGSVLALAQTSDAASPVVSGIDVTRAEVEFAVTAEGALDADDVLDRRTRIGLVPADRERARPAVEELVAQALARVAAG